MGIVKENNLVDNLYKGNYTFLINIIIVHVIKYYFINKTIYTIKKKNTS